MEVVDLPREEFKTTVTGPSLIKETSIFAPKIPSFTLDGRYAALTLSTNSANGTYKNACRVKAKHNKEKEKQITLVLFDHKRVCQRSLEHLIL